MRGEPFPLSAELFEAAVALAVYTASSGNPMPQSPKEREWKLWYVNNYNAEWRGDGFTKFHKVGGQVTVRKTHVNRGLAD